ASVTAPVRTSVRCSGWRRRRARRWADLHVVSCVSCALVGAASAAPTGIGGGAFAGGELAASAAPTGSGRGRLRWFPRRRRTFHAALPAPPCARCGGGSTG